MVLNDLLDSFCYSQKNAGLKGLNRGPWSDRLFSPRVLITWLIGSTGVISFSDETKLTDGPNVKAINHILADAKVISKLRITHSNSCAIAKH